MKNTLWLLCLVSFISVSSLRSRDSYAASSNSNSKKNSAAAAEQNPVSISQDPWKGEPERPELGAGGMAGIGVLDGTAGFAVLGNFSARIVRKGFVPDVNNSVWLEAELGPLFISGTTALQYSAHLRWDFNQNLDWTYYALGGLGGAVIGPSGIAKFELIPRFGLGLIRHLDNVLSLRAEVSHEFVGVGISAVF